MDDFVIRKFDDPILRRECDAISPGHPDLKRIISDMRLGCEVGRGVGIAAPQVGYGVRVILVLDEILINPVVAWKSSIHATLKEGCLSFPGTVVEVRRSTGVRITYHGEDGKKKKRLFTGMEARIALHEIDHLNGVCLVGDEWERKKALRNG